MLWRPVVAGYGTLMEVKERWSIDDVMDAHDVLDHQQEMQERALAQARGKR